MKLNFDVTRSEYEIIRDILVTHLPPHCKVGVFGSRAKYNTRTGSDIDLALEAHDKIDKRIIYDLKEAFTESRLPYRVDIVDMNNIDDRFKEIVQGQLVTFPIQSHNTPRLRFPEFTDPWQEKKLGEVGTFQGGGTPDTEIEEYWNGNIPWVSSSDIFEDNIYHINISRFINQNALIQSATKIIPRNSILIVSRVGVGKIALSKNEICTSQDFCNFTSLSQNNEYIAWWLLANKQKLLSLCQGTSIKGLTSVELKNLIIKLPSLPEQQKIAGVLEAVDEKIAVLNKKLSLMNEYKKGMMQKLFSQNLRFTDENNNQYPDWQEKKLGEVVTFLKGKSLPKSAIVPNGQYPCIHYGELFTEYSEVIENVKSYTDSNQNLILSVKNDVLMPTSDVTPNGLAKASCIKIDDVILGGDILIIRPSNSYIKGEFLSRLIRYKENNVLQLVSGTTVFHLYASSMEKLTLSFPSLPEQQKIAEFLGAIDEKISLLKQQIEQTTLFKKSLLQQLFV